MPIVRHTGRSGMQIIIALVIAAVGVIGYFAKPKTKNPVTGELQRVSLSVDQEKALGLRSAPKMAEQMGGVLDPRQDARAAQVAEVGRKLVQTSDAKNSPYVGNYNFYLLKDPKTVNAFALPGGQIFITVALYEQMQHEAHLAGVLGHEIGHVIHRHSAEHMAKGQLGQSLATAVGVAASDGGGSGQGAAVMAQMANQMIQLKYGRNDELESDSTGLKYMVQAGYDPSAMLEVMAILAKASGGGGRGPDFMSSHPHPEARVDQIKAFLRTNFPNGVPSNLTKGRPLTRAGQRLESRQPQAGEPGWRLE